MSKKPTKYKGIYPALITPFDKDGNVKWKELEQIVNYLIEVQKVDGLYVTGSTGEFLLLSVEERKKIFDVVAKVAKGKIVLIAQIGSINITEAIEMAKHAEKAGFDGVSAITPFYYPFSYEEIKHYYEVLSSSTNLDMFIYYLPQYAGGSMTTKQFSELLHVKNVVGVKYGAMNIHTFERLIHNNPDKVFFYAWDEALSCGWLLGADGFIGSTYNTNAKAVREILATLEKGDFKKVRELVHVYNDYVDEVVGNGLMQTLKAIFKLEGIDAGYNKAPFSKKDEAKLAEVAKNIKEKYLK